MIIPRITIQNSVSLSGTGLHSAEPVQLTFHPGTEGIWFRCGTERVSEGNAFRSAAKTTFGPLG